MKIVLTGNIASGKSTLIQWLRQYEDPLDSQLGSISLIDADSVVHKLYQTPPLIELIKSHFGEKTVQAGRVDRKALGDIVFNKQSKLEELNTITKEPIRKALEKEISEKSPHFKFIFVEATLVVERDWISFFDYSICVTCTDSIRLKRLRDRNNLTEIQAQARLDSQVSQTKKAAACDYQIKNNGTKEELIATFEKILRSL
jgi:dephospho-CoA kinase